MKLINGDCLEVIEELYTINKNGTIIRKSTNKVVKFSKDWKGYMKARIFLPKLSKHPDKRKPFRLHRLLAMKYIKEYSEDLQVNHINGIKDDNRLCNLEMVTNAQNAKHGWSLPNKKARLSKLKWDKKGRFITNKE